MPDDGRREAGWLRRRLQEVPERGRADEMSRQLTAMIREVLGAGDDLRLPPDARMFELGLGSMLLVELKRRLDDGFQADLPVTLFFQHASVGQLVAHLLSDVLDASPATRPAVSSPAPPEVPAVSDIALDDVAGLTEEEAEQRIADLLAETERDGTP